MYLTYSEYIQMGGTLDETAFFNLEFQARSVIDWWTFNRLQNNTEFPEAVKRCTYALINLMAVKQAIQTPSSDEQANSVGYSKHDIVSQSNDGVTTTYNVLSAENVLKNSKGEIENTIKFYLNGVKNSLGRKVLYRGLYPDE